MSTTAIYKVVATWFDDAEVSLQVDLDVLTKDLATMINQFWGDSAHRVDAESGDVVRAVVRLFGCQAIRHFMECGGAIFDAQGNNRDRTQEVIEAQGEGWPDFDGLGILIRSANVTVVDYDSLYMEAV